MANTVSIVGESGKGAPISLLVPGARNPRYATVYTIRIMIRKKITKSSPAGKIMSYMIDKYVWFTNNKLKKVV